jgi:hypothetical protein
MQTIPEADLRNIETFRGRSKFLHTHSMAPETRQVTRAWEALTPPLSEWVLDAISSMGFLKMTPVQANCIPLFMGNKDVVVEVGDLVCVDKSSLMIDVGCHGKRENSSISYTNRRKAIKAIRPYQTTSCRSDYHFAYQVCCHINGLRFSLSCIQGTRSTDLHSAARTVTISSTIRSSVEATRS